MTEGPVMEYEGIKIKNAMRLLPVTLAAGAGQSILQWRPFEGGRTLDELVEGHNKRCMDSLRSRWMRDYISSLAELVEVVKFDLSRVDQLSIEEFKGIRILLVDLDAVRGREQQLATIRVKMNHYSDRYTFYLVQIARVAGARSVLGEFDLLPVYLPRGEEILTDEKQLREFLGSFCNYLYIRDVPEPPSPDEDPLADKIRQSYVDRLPTIAADMRDTAMARGLSVEEAQIMARAQATEELLLARVEEQARPDPEYRVVVDSLREPITDDHLDVYAHSPTLRSFDLLELNATRPLDELTDEQRGIMGGLGIEGDDVAAVHFDKSSVHEAMDALGDAIEFSEFSAQLPSWE